jgi:transcription-repair coupling factor (superfamily II helicase)
VYEIEEEANDRFGRLDLNTKQFFELIVIKLLSIEKSITLIGNYGQNISITYSNGSTESIKAASKDDDDIIKEVLTYLRNAKRKTL